MINTKTIGYVLTKTPSRALARQCWSKATTTRRVSFIETHKKWGGVFLKHSKSGGVSFISIKMTHKQVSVVAEVIHVK